MTTIKGPAIFLAQFAGDDPPFNKLGEIATWAAGLGYKGVQIPSWDARFIDLKQAAESVAYCDDLQATLAGAGISLTELSTHLQGQLVAVHPAYDSLFDSFGRNMPLSPERWLGRTSTPGRSVPLASSKPPSANSRNAGIPSWTSLTNTA